MNIRFLGTGAADWPNPGEKVGDGRRESSLVVNGNIMIDCGRMTVPAIDEFGVDVNALTDVVIGHPHGDHFSMEQLCIIAQRRDDALPPLVVHVDAKATLRSPVPQELAQKLVLHPYVTFDFLTCSGATIQTLPANHELQDPEEKPSHLYITFDNGETMFYALDGAWFFKETWKYLQKHRMDVIVWELTCGNLADWRLWGHSNLGMLKLMADAFRNDGTIHDNTTMFCSHLARTLCPPHDIYARELKTDGFILAKDGMYWERG